MHLNHFDELFNWRAGWNLLPAGEKSNLDWALLGRAAEQTPAPCHYHPQGVSVVSHFIPSSVFMCEASMTAEFKALPSSSVVLSKQQLKTVEFSLLHPILPPVRNPVSSGWRSGVSLWRRPWRTRQDKNSSSSSWSQSSARKTCGEPTEFGSFCISV